MQMAIPTIVAILTVLTVPTGLTHDSTGSRLNGWVPVPEPQPGKELLVCGAWTPWHAEVLARGESVEAGLSSGGVRGLRPPFPVKGRTTYPGITARPVSDGWLVSVDDGEFGGNFSWYSRDGKEQQLIADTRIVAFIPSAENGEEALLVLEGFSHLSKTEGSISLVRRVGSSWKREAVAILPGKPRLFVREASGSILIVHDNGVARFTTDRKVVPIASVYLFGLNPSSLLVQPSGEVFVGMLRFVLRILPDGSREWYVPAGCERFTAIDPLEPGGPECLCQGWPQPQQRRR